MPDTDLMDIKPYYTITKVRKSPANGELERHLLDVTCCQAIKPLGFKSNTLTNRRNTEEKSSRLYNRSKLHPTSTHPKTNNGWRFLPNIPLFITFVVFKKAFRLNWSGYDVCYLTTLWNFREDCLGDSCYILSDDKPAIRTNCYYHLSVTMWWTSTISIHHRDRLSYF